MEFTEDELCLALGALNGQIADMTAKRAANPRVAARPMDALARLRDRFADVLSSLVGEYEYDSPRRGGREDFHSDG